MCTSASIGGGVALWGTATLGGLMVVTYLPGVFLRLWGKWHLRRRCRGKLALTFDDGPGPTLTPRVLAMLAKHDAKATFFVAGFRAHRHPELCDSTVRAGHEIGSHGYRHRNAWRWPLRSVWDVFVGCRAARKWAPRGQVFRPPFGKSTLWTWLVTRLYGCPTVLWTIDTRDAMSQPNSMDRIIQQFQAEQGGVVLLHDSEHVENPARDNRTIEISEQLLSTARHMGIECCTVSQLLRCGRSSTGPGRQATAEVTGDRALDAGSSRHRCPE